MALYLLMTNDEDWFDWHVANAYGDNSVSFGQDFATTFTTARVRGVSSSGAQQSVNQTSGLVAVSAGTAPNTYNQVISFDIGNAPVGTVVTAVSSAFDSSNTAQRVVEINRRTAWQISDGNRTAHFKPNTNGNFDDDTAYEDNAANNPT